VGSDNPSGADNQQERPSFSNWLDRVPSDLGNWVAGFVDGEGSFNVPIRRDLQGRHLSPAGIGEVLVLRGPMNRGGKSRYGADYVRAVLREWESSEAIRKAPSLKQADEDMVHAL
jgi:hypothetical protein